MAPEPKDFNLVGYLLPGIAITMGAAVLAFVIGRRERQRSLAMAAAAGPPPPSGAIAPSSQPTAEELDRLRRELAEVDD